MGNPDLNQQTAAQPASLSEPAGNGARRLAVRIEESSQEIERLIDEFDEWLRRCRRRDEVGQYQTQLEHLEFALRGALHALGDDLNAVRPGDGPGAVYVRCRATDKRTVFIRRFWTYFKDRFDQRDDPALKPLLKAADEVVWSCYAQTFAGVDAPPPSAPLPYIEPQHSPRALARSLPPPELATDARDPVLRDALKTMPIPVIGLPSISVARPWWLIYLAHETGHQIQADLGDGALRKGFDDLLERVAPAWQAWSRECFADAVATLTIGTTAGQAMAALEASDNAGQLRAVPRYPPPLLRRALMDGIVLAASALDADRPVDDPAGLAAAAAQPVIDRARHAIAELELAPAEEALRAAPVEAVESLGAIIVAVVAEPLLDTATLRHICGWRADYEDQVAGWCSDFRRPDPPFPEHRLHSARLATAGAYCAWLQIAELDDAERRSDQATLRERIPETVSRCGEPAVRAAPPPSRAGLEGPAQALIDHMMTRLGEDDEP